MLQAGSGLGPMAQRKGNLGSVFIQGLGPAWGSAGGGTVQKESSALKIVLAQPRGFCAGVVRAIDIVERALTRYGAPIYVRHEIVHNGHVVEDLKTKGVRFVEDLSEVPDGAVTIFSAHGVSRAVADEARRRGLP